VEALIYRSRNHCWNSIFLGDLFGQDDVHAILIEGSNSEYHARGH